MLSRDLNKMSPHTAQGHARAFEVWIAWVKEHAQENDKAGMKLLSHLTKQAEHWRLVAEILKGGDTSPKPIAEGGGYVYHPR
jgi:hypothetical protein